MSYTQDERETIINILEADKTTASVYTCIASQMRRLEKLAEQYPDDVILESKDENSCTYTVPKKWVKIRPPRKISDEQREKAAERIKQWRESRNAHEND